MGNSIRTDGQTDRRTWIDVCKFFAIMGVLIDHVNHILYTNQIFAWASYYSVSLFILVSGYNTFLSYNRKPYGIRKVIKKCNSMIIPYAVAVFVFDITSDCYFSLYDYIYMLVHFNASGPHYYVLLYLQLVIIGPLLAYLICSGDGKFICIRYILVIAGTIIISIFTTNNTELLGVYGGGGCLLGGTFLVLFATGMIIAKERTLIERVGSWSLLGVVILAVAVPYWVHFIYLDRLSLDSKLSFGAGFNPPSVSFGLYALLLFGFIYFFSIYINSLGCIWLSKCIKPIVFIGNHTLYIFLYHRLFLDSININHLVLDYNYILVQLYQNIWIRRVFLFTIMIIGPIVVEYTLKNLRNYMVRVYLG